MRFFKIPENEIILEKENCYNSCKIVFSPKLMFSNSKNDIEIFSKKIIFFLETVKTKCTHFNYERFINNFKKTYFDISNIDLDLPFYGNVTYNKKRMRYYVNSLDIVYHELFHLSTSFYSKNSFAFFSGFHFNNDYVDLGFGINEGYTQLLAERYFKESVGESYVFEVKIVKALEKIVGADIIEQCYFESNLKKLMNELEKYNTGENVLNFIQNIDSIKERNLYTGEGNETRKIKFLKEKINEVYVFLLDCIKIKIEILKKTTSSTELKKYIKELLDSCNWLDDYTTKKDKEKILYLKKEISQ